MRRVMGVFVVLLVCLGIPAPSSAQGVPPADPTGRQESDFHLEQNYPNPFNPETKIPFVLDEDLFSSGTPVVVSLRVYNVLQQFEELAALKLKRADFHGDWTHTILSKHRKK